MENAILSFLSPRARVRGGNEDRKLDFRIKIWIKINMEKLKFDSLVIYMSAGESSMKKGWWVRILVVTV